MVLRLAGVLLFLAAGLSGCGGTSSLAPDASVRVGQREADLVAVKGQPQKVLPGPGGGKTYVYSTINLDQTAVMGGGAWAKPDETHYQMDAQGVIVKVKRYPYGKRRFLLPPEEEPVQTAAAPLPKAEPQPPAAEPSPAPAPPAAAPPAPVPAAPPPPVPAPAKEEAPKAAPQPPPPPPPAARVQPPPVVRPPSPPPGMDAAVRLELNMTREEIRRVLGLPERTEGYRVGGKAVVVWFYLLEDRQGRRVSTPLVFENGRLSGWGETHYRRLLREASP